MYSRFQKAQIPEFHSYQDSGFRIPKSMTPNKNFLDYHPWGEINKIDISMNLILAISSSPSFYCRWSFGVVLWELATMGKLVL